MIASLSTTSLYTAWHLNLDYSSLDQDQLPEVIEECYWPLLRLAESTGCVQGVEISGRTLEKISYLDSEWVTKFRTLIHIGLVEPLASGYSQIIGPLAPSSVNRENFRRGAAVFQDLLSVSPKVAFVNEQCSSEGFLKLLSRMGFDGAVVEWENMWFANPKMGEDIGYRPQRLSTSDGIGIVWNHSRFFQGLQRLVHGELSLADYEALFDSANKFANQKICFYGGDAEVFNFRPRRFNSEAPISKNEWKKIESLVRRTVDSGATWVAPSKLLEELPDFGINFFSLSHQIITKKQAKYNAVRWAVSGRNSYELNNHAFRTHFGEIREIEHVSNPREVIDLKIWRSDLRTHIHPRRWQALLSEVPGLEATSSNASGSAWPARSEFRLLTDHHPIRLTNQHLEVLVDSSRGFSVQSLRLKCPCEANLIGRHSFGLVPGPIPSPDWYSGTFTYQEPGQSQVTDLSADIGRIHLLFSGGALFSLIEYPTFDLYKKIEVAEGSRHVNFAYRIEWRGASRGLIRVGHLAFDPSSWDWETTSFFAANGGEVRSSYRVKHKTSNHSQPVSLAVSATNCVGITDGGYHVEDNLHRLEVSVDTSNRGAVVLIDNSAFNDLQLLRTAFSIQEIDDTFQERKVKFTDFRFSVKASCVFSS